MSHAVVMKVVLGEGDQEEATEMLRQLVVPQAKAQAGFEHGTWMRLGTQGMGVVVFDTPEHAQAASEALKPPPGGPELVSVDVYEVGAEA